MCYNIIIRRFRKILKERFVITIGDFNSTKYKNEYAKQNYDAIRVVVPVGGKEKIKQFADARSMSVNAFVNYCIKQEMEKETKR